MRTALGSLRQDGGSFVEQFKQKLKQCRKLYKQLLLCTIISGRQILLVTAQLALWTALMAQEIFYQESCTESLQLMKGPVLFVAYPPIRDSRYRNYAMEVREALKAYVNSELGAVSWQWEYTMLELNF